MTRIKDIALKAGVSTATVSHVLNDTGRVGLETRKNVLKVINDLNYTPNKIAKSLKMKKTSTVGIIAEDVTVFNTPEIIDGINQMAETHGLGIILINLRVEKKMGTNFSNSDQLRELIGTAFEQLYMNQVDGIIYIGTYNRDITNVIPPTSVPVVYTYCYTTNETDYTVNYDDAMGGFDSTKYLIELGHKNIALISGFIDSIHTHERFNGYQKALIDYGITFNPSYIKTGDWETESGYLLTKELLSLPERPSAIIALNDLMAYGSITAAKEVGLDVPKDLSIVGFDNRELSGFTTPKLTTMSIPLHKMGEKSLEILYSLINNQQEEIRKVKLKCDLVKRKSARRI